MGQIKNIKLHIVTDIKNHQAIYQDIFQLKQQQKQEQQWENQWTPTMELDRFSIPKT